MGIIVNNNIRAPTHRKLHWNQINWNKVEKRVKQLQMRIAKATSIRYKLLGDSLSGIALISARAG
jgi:hypothetical protein